MGLLSVGTPLPWDEAKKHADHIRKHGIIQFVNIWNRLKSRRRDKLYWGDEVEYIIVHLDEQKEKATATLDAYDLLLKLEKMEKESVEESGSFPSSWKPEYGRYMLEATPGQPYGSTLNDLLTVEANMRARRLLAQQHTKPGEHIVTITNFPRLGSPGFMNASAPNPNAGSSRSLFISDDAINPHPRFRTLTANIRERRGSKVAINMPIFKDTKTPSPFREPAPACMACPETDIAEIANASNSFLPHPPAVPANISKSDLPSLQDLVPDAKDDHIYMDCMCFGMGCCCLQVTFQACSVEEARRLYDHLAVMSPIMMAISAAAPIFRGYLADVDCRWSVISGSVDDRTKEERGVLPQETARFKIPKSRYDSISTYLSAGPSYSGGCSEVPSSVVKGGFYDPKYNDLPLVYDKEICEELQKNGVDELLARHYAHLFIRDPMVIFEELLNVDDMKSSDHFENIQSTNWQTMRFKPPPPNSDIGWRVEFRSMEIQMTDFENAAFALFVVLLTRTILSYDLNLYIPLSKVDANMQTAHKRDAVLKEKFWFRKNLFSTASGGKQGIPSVVTNGVENGTNGVADEDPDAYELMTIDEIMNGKDEHHPGVIQLIKSYLSSTPILPATVAKLTEYVNCISDKAAGRVPTTARWIRNFVSAHPDYKQDSVVSDKINFDLIKRVYELGMAQGSVKGLSSV